MKRLFHQTKLYDYTSIKEAEKHIKEMETKGWYPFRKLNDIIFLNGNDEFKYSVEFYKEH